MTTALAVLILLAAPRPTRADDPPTLSPQVGVEREISAGDVHVYRLRLEEGQYVRLAADVRGIALAATLRPEDGRPLLEAYLYHEPEAPVPLTAVVSRGGDYLLELRAARPTRLGGWYAFEIAEQREAEDLDAQRVAADRLLAEGTRLYAEKEEEGPGQALEKYRRSLALYEEIEDRAGRAEALEAIGTIHKFMGERTEALELFGAALELQEELGAERKQAFLLQAMGWLVGNLGRRQEALEACRRSLEIFERLGDRRGQSFALDKIGQIHRALGQLPEALDHYRRALVLQEGEWDHSHRATILNNLALALDHSGEPQKALESYHAALELMTELGEMRSVAVVYNNLALIYAQFRDFDRAIDHCHKMLEIFRDRGDRWYEAAALGNCGLFYAQAERPRDALRSYEEALEIGRAVDDRETVAFMLLRIGTVRREAGEFEAAREAYGRAREIFEEIGPYRGHADTLLGLGEIHRRRNERSEAAHLFAEVLELARASGDRRYEARAIYGLAAVESGRGHLDAARRHLEEALRILDSVIVKIAGRKLRRSGRIVMAEVFELYIDVLMRLCHRHPEAGWDRAALEASERSRARGLVELLEEARVDLRQGVAAELLADERRLREKLNAVERERVALLTKSPDDERAAELEGELTALLADYEDVQAGIRAESPQYAALTRAEPMRTEEIQRLLDDDTLLLEFVLGQERSFVWALGRASFTSAELAPGPDVAASARRLYEALTARHRYPDFETPAERQRRLAAADAESPRAAAELSRMLIEPIAEHLGRRRLLVVASGALGYIPFGILPDPRGRGDTPLLVSQEVVHLPSASVLEVLRRASGHRDGGAAAEKLLAVLADPVFTDDDPRIRREAELLSARETSRGAVSAPPTTLERSARDLGLRRFERLPGTRKEAQALADLAGEDRFVALDFAASRQTAMSRELGRYRIVHFATHAVLNARHPDLSGLVLSLIDEDHEPANGFLRLHDIYQLRLRAELVVLSACQTALGEEVRSEGLVGLTRGFLHAGARAVVSSLWSPEDEATAELMRRFYRAMLGEGLTASAALRAAQLSMRREERFQAPYFWAAFVLQGDWRVRIKD